MNIGDHVFAYFEGNRALPRIAGHGLVTDLFVHPGLYGVRMDDDAMPPAVRGQVVLFDRDKVQAADRWAWKRLNGQTIDIVDGSISTASMATITIPTHELERRTREAYEAGVRTACASMATHVTVTEHGVTVEGRNVDAATARKLARDLIEAADALDPFPTDEKIDASNDPPKCAECKGTGIDIVNQITKCPQCDGSGY